MKTTKQLESLNNAMFLDSLNNINGGRLDPPIPIPTGDLVRTNVNEKNQDHYFQPEVAMHKVAS